MPLVSPIRFEFVSYILFYDYDREFREGGGLAFFSFLFMSSIDWSGMISGGLYICMYFLVVVDSQLGGINHTL